MQAALGITLALLARERTGRGQYIDLSITDGVFFMNWVMNLRSQRFRRVLSRDRDMKERLLSTLIDRITRDDLSPQILETREPSLAGAAGTLKEKVEQAERAEIARALDLADGNQTRAAKSLGISRVWLRKKMEKYGLLK